MLGDSSIAGWWRYFCVFGVSAVVFCGMVGAATDGAAQTPPQEKTLSLKQLEQSIGGNIDLRVAEKRLEAADAARKVVLAKFFPNITVSVGANVGGPELIVNGRAVNQTTTWNAQIGASVVLLDPTLFPQYSAAKSREEQWRLGREWAEKTVRFQAKKAYFELAAAQRDLQNAEQIYELRKKYFARAEAMLAQNLGLPIDVSRAKTQVLQAEQAILTAKALISERANILEIMLGREPTGNLRALPELLLAKPINKTDKNTSGVERQGVAQSAEAGGLNRREDLQRMAFAVQEAEYNKNIVFWSFFPTLSLQANARLGRPTNTSPDGYSWSVGLNLNWTLLSGGSRFFQQNQRDAELEVSQLLMSQAASQATADAAKAITDTYTASKSTEIADEIVAVAQQTYSNAAQRFEAGLVTSIDVTDASRALFDAQRDATRAYLALRIAESRVEYLLTLAP